MPLPNSRRHRALQGQRFLVLCLATCFAGPALAQAGPAIQDVCYVASDDNDRLTLLDPRTGEELDLGPIVSTNGASVTDIEALTIDPDTGTLYAANGGQLGTLDRATGVFNPLPSAPTVQIGFNGLTAVTFDDFDALAYDPVTDVIWACERRGSNDVLLQLDPTTGLYRDNAMGGNDYILLDSTGTNDCDDLAIRPTSNELWAVLSDGASNDRLVRIDKSTFAITAAPNLINASNSALDDVEGLAFAADGQLYATTGADNQLMKLDPATGLGTLIGTLDFADNEGLACFTRASSCGDGALADNEQCDDGNATPGDGCSSCVLDATPQFCSDASDGALTITASTILNTYHPGIGSAPAGATTLSLGASRGATTAIAPGDLLLVIQMQSASIDPGASANANESFGDGPSFNDRRGHLATSEFTAGLYERVRATTSVIGGTLGITGEGPNGGLVHSYVSNSAVSASLGVRTFQVVRIPEPASLRLQASLTASPWDGSTGGIASVSVQGTLTFASGGIDVSALGFRGGVGATSNNNVQNQAGFPGERGEGIAGRPRKTFASSGRTFVDYGTSGYPSSPEGVGAPGTGGGPATRTIDAGAGGGGNGGFGGRGGAGSNQNLTRSGLGGAPLSGPQHLFPTRHRMTLGGGGGGASGDDPLPGDGSSTSGQSGGGIILLWADNITGSAGYLKANGAAAIVDAGEGGGGGGAGGTIFVSTRRRQLPADTTVEAKGGPGVGMTLDSDGSGGGGGGGLIFLDRTSVTKSDVSGGPGGSATSGGVYIGRSGTAGIARANVPPSIGATCTFSFPPAATADTADTDEDTAVNIKVLGNDTDPDADPLIVTIATAPSLGSVSVDATGLVTYTPAANKNGEDSFSYRTCDPSGLCASASVKVNIRPVNDAPVAVDDTFSVAEDSAATTLDVASNDTDPDLETSPLTVTAVTQPTRGGRVNLDNGRVIFTPSANFSGIVTFEYTIADAARTTDTGLVTVTVTNTNDPPDAIDDALTLAEDAPATLIAVLSNDIDLDSPSLTLTAVTQPASGGSVSIENNSAKFTPALNFNGTVTFTYTVSDGSLTDTAAVTITVTPVNDAPTARTDFVTIDEDSTATTIDVLGNDSDPEGLPLTVFSVSVSQNGTAKLENGIVTFTPAANFSGSTFFTYQIRDSGNLGAGATVLITVRPLPDAPVANPDTFTVAEDSLATSLNVLTNDTDPDGDILKIQSVTQPSDGLVTLSDNSLKFTPGTNFNGAISFTYTVTDPSGRTATATATVTVTASNDAPVANDDNGAAPSGGLVTVDVIENDTDIDGDHLSVSAVSESADGILTFTSRTITFRAREGFSGETTFTYKVTDGLLTDQATVTITVLRFGLFDDRYTVRNDGLLEVPAPGVLENDILPEPAEVNLETRPASGTLTLKTDGAFTFDPDEDFVGEVEFVYSVTIGADTAKATVRIEIHPRPAGTDDTLILDEDTDAELDVTANDTFDHIDTIDIGTEPLHGELTLSQDGLALYRPGPEYSGEDRFTYRLCDGPTCFESEVLVTVREVADPPVATPDRATVNRETLIAVLENDLDPEGSRLTLASISTPESGTATIVDDKILYTPAADFEGLVTLTYEVCDETSLCVESSVEITVLIVRLPVAVDDTLVTETNIPVTFDPLENDLDPNAAAGSILSVVGVGDPSHGLALLEPDGRVTYTSQPGFIGVDTFTVTISDSAGETDESLTTVTVTPRPNRPPSASDDALTLDEDAPPTFIAVLENDSDPDEDTLAITAVELDPMTGTADIDGSDVVFSPAPDFNGTTLIRYSVDDGRGGTSSADILITIEPVNDRPTAVSDAFEVDEDSPSITLAVLDNDTDIENDQLEIIANTDPDAGATVTLANGEIIVELDNNYFGDVTFSYTVSDGLLSDSADVTLTVRPLPDPPLASPDRALALKDGGPINIAVLDNDKDPDGDLLSLMSVTSSNGGQTSLENGNIVFTPASGFEGETTFEYTISDPSGLTATATVTVIVSSLFAENDTYTVRSDDVLVIPAPGLLGNDLAPATATVALVEPADPTPGTLTLDPDGGFRFDPAADFRGEATFTYRLSSGDSSSLATLTITVTPAPEAGDDLVETPEDTPILIAVLENDLASEAAVLTPGSPTHGTATARPDGILYIPEPDFVGVDIFEYERCENDRCQIARISVTVSPIADPPRPVDDDAVTPAGLPVTVDVLLNDWHPEGRSFTLTDAEAPTRGQITLTETTLTYTPDLGYAGLDRVRYSACDDAGLCAEGLVSIIVGQGNRRPVGRPDFYSIEAGDQLDLRVLLNDSDPERSPLTLLDVGDARHGETLRIGSVISYSADADFDGLEHFTYTVCDAEDACAIVDVFVTIDPDGNRPPAALDDEVVTTGVLRFDPTDNDHDPDGDVLTLFSLGDAAHGDVALENGEIVYTPEAEFFGDDAFEVTISDADGFTSTSVAFVHVRPELPPAAAPEDDRLSASGLESTLLDVLENDIENGSEKIRLYAVTQPSHGSVSFSDGGLLYQPEPGFSGEVTLLYSVIDDLGQTATAEAIVSLGDHDGDGLPDSVEVTLGTDPDKADTDGDGISDGVEIADGNPQAVDPTDTNPLDIDSDDDALADGDEIDLGTNPRLADTDGDGLPDGLELGREQAISGAEGLAGTDPDRFRPDLDPETTTDPLDADSDDDGLVDGDEDTNVNGRWDGLLGDTGTEGLGETDPTLADTDGDGLFDGTERGVSTPSVDTDLDIFLPDLDPETTTDPLDPDTDDGGVSDGDEDTNLNGRVDGGERNPVDNPKDDALKVGRSSGCNQGPIGLGLLPLGILLLRRRAFRPRMKT